ncbi:MAG: hypothetical protein SPK03_07425 [Alloprevotella sp.]|nr:hypothetical protein [Alloprevotella sp.]
MRKLYLLLALLLTFSSSAWADFDQPWTGTPSPWSNQAATGVPDAVTSVKTESDGTVYSSTVEAVRLEGDSRSITVGFTFTSGNYALRILGVELLNSSREVITASSVYEKKSAGLINQRPAGAIYTLSTNGVTAGTYYLRYYVCVGSTENITGTNGIITVRGLNAAAGTGLTNYKSITSLNDLSNDKLYLLKSGRSFGSSSNHYVLWNGSVAPNNLSCTYLAANSMEFSATTTNFQFAIYKSGNAYYLYNMAAGKFVGNNNNNNGAIPMVKIPTNQVYFKASENGTYNWMLSTNNFGGALNAADNSNGILNWTGGNNIKTDLGNCFNIIEVDGANVTADLQATLETYIGWGPKYNAINAAIASPSDVLVGAISTSGETAVSSACVTFAETPNQSNYDAMVSAYENAKITLNEGEVFTIQCKETNRGYLAYSPSHSKTHAYLAGTGGGWVTKFPATTAEGVSIKWAYYVKDGKKYLYNYDSKLYIGASNMNGENGNIPLNYKRWIEINADESNPLIHRILFEGNSQRMLSFSPGYDGIAAVRTYSSFTDGGVQFYLTKTGDTATETDLDLAAASFEKFTLKEKLDAMNGFTIGTALGEFNNSEGTAQTVKDNATSTYNNANATYAEVTAAIAAMEGININQPVPGKLYRFKNKAAAAVVSDGYMQYMKADVAGQQMTMTNTIDDYATIFMVREGNPIDGKPAFKLLSYKTGYYSKLTHTNGASFNDANSILFKASEGGYAGYYTLKTDLAGGDGTYIYGWSTQNKTKIDRNSSYAANNCDWQIEEVTWLPIPINTAYGFGTIVPPADLALVSGDYAADERLKFYTATIGTDGYVELKKVTENIKAGEPYVVELVAEKGMSQGSQFMKIASSAPELSAPNALRGSYETVATPTNEGTIYTLQAAWVSENSVSEDEVAFRQYNGATIQGFRAYLPVANNRQIAGMRIVDGDVTRIEGVNAEDSHKVDVYDLSGRRVERATKGLYIINGKKVIVK